MDDLDYRQRVVHLLETVQRAGDKQARRALERDHALLTDLRWWPALLNLLAMPPTPRLTLPGLEGMWFPTVPGMPTRTTVTIADAEPLTTAVRKVLSRLPLRRLGPAGAVNLLLTAQDLDTLAEETSRFSPLIDDSFFDALLELSVEAEGLGLEAFSRKVEALRQLLLSFLTQKALTELAAQVIHARSDHEAASLVVRRARTASQWLQMGLEEIIPRARKGEVMSPLPVAIALQRALAARAKGQDEAALLADLERWRPLQQFLHQYRLLQKAPFRPGEDGLARYGARAKAFFLQLAQVQGAQRAALLQLALAESEAEEEAAIASEPRMFSAEGEQQARALAAEAEQQGQYTLAAKLSAAAARIADLLAELARPEQNPVARLAEQVDNGKLSLDEALAQTEGPELGQNVRIPHLAALDEQVVHLLRSGDLHRAELLAALNHAAARRTGHAKIRADTALSLAEIRSELGQHQKALPLFEEAARLAEQVDDSLRLILAVGPMGTTYREMSNYGEARRCYERALALARAAGAEELEIAALGNLADLYLQTGDTEAALSFSEQALALARVVGDPYQIAQSLGTRAAALHRTGRLEEAVDLYQETLEALREMADLGSEARTRLHLGQALAELGRTDEALAELEQAHHLAEQTGNWPLQADARATIGYLHILREDLPRGLEHLKAAIALLEQQRAALSQVEAFERRYAASRQDVYRLAAETALRLGRPLEALEMLEQGRARLLARRLFQREALPPTVPEELRERFTRTLQAVQVLRNLVYGKPSWGARLMEEVRLGAEALSKARSEEEHERLVAQARAQEQQQMRQALAEAEAELEEVIRQVQQYLPGFAPQVALPPLDWDEITSDPTTAVVALFVGQQTGAAVLLHPSGVRVVDLPGLRRAEVSRLLYDLPEPLAQAREEAQRQLAQEPDSGLAALILHYLTLRWMIEQAPAFKLGWQVALHTLISEKRKADELRRIRERLKSRFKERNISIPEPEKTLFDLDDEQRLSLWRHLLDDMAAGLRERLWQPLLPALGGLGAERVVLVPDAALHTLPLTLGLADETGAPAIAMAPSLRLYAQCARRLREQEPREDTLLLIANPTGDLAAADVEAELLCDLFAAHRQVTFTLTGEEATMDNVIRTARVGRYWHFAGHARYEWWDPSLSALRLAKGKPLPLFWASIWLDLRATRLAVLSACETAMTPSRDPTQEFEGLFAAFLVAGAPAVLASLWPVAELSTALLIYRFYQYHLGDPREGLAPRSPAEALRDAQQWLRTLPAAKALHHPLVEAVRRQNPKRESPLWQQLLALESGVKYPYANPYFWAGFVLVGV